MIQSFADWLVYGIFGLDSATKIGQAVNFFFYDSLKILILLFLISAVMGVINAYFPIDRLRNFLQSHKLYGLDYLLASLFGAITPFCSCSSIPLFIGFVKGGIPLGVTFSFLVTSPLVNEVAVAMFLGTFGVKVTVIYVLSGILLGTIAGIFLGRFRLERFLSPWVIKIQQQSMAETQAWIKDNTSFWKRLPNILKDSWDIGFFSGALGSGKWWTVPLAVVLAVPMYSNAAGIIPLIEAFVQKGVALGTAISFMMAVVGLSLPEATMLKKVMTWKLIGIFFGAVTLLIVLSGWLFNAIL